MIRRLCAAAGLLALTACDPGMTSEAALFSAGPEPARPGLWALLQEGCTAPQAAAVQDWPACASPVWITANKLTVMATGPVRSPFLLSDGSPRIAQLGPSEEAFSLTGERTKGFSYYAVRPEGPAPFARARLWALGCPEPGEAPDQTAPGEGCAAVSAESVRAIAGRAASSGPGNLAVWIAPG